MPGGLVEIQEFRQVYPFDSLPRTLPLDHLHAAGGFGKSCARIRHVSKMRPICQAEEGPIAENLRVQHYEHGLLVAGRKQGAQLIPHWKLPPVKKRGQLESRK